jgi:hypothetical protein
MSIKDFRCFSILANATVESRPSKSKYTPITSDSRQKSSTYFELAEEAPDQSQKPLQK